jgi:tetratricopeptide (TPR) repeat protein
MQTDKPDPETFRGLANELLNRIEEFESNVSSRVHHASRKGTSISLFSLILLVPIFVVLFLFIRSEGRKNAELKAELLGNVKSEIGAQLKSTNKVDLSEALAERIKFLEFKQASTLEEGRNSMERSNLTFTTIAAFFGLFSLYFGYRQLTLDAKHESAGDQHDREMRGLVASFQQNINTINSLITTLEKSYDYRKELQAELADIKGRAKDLEVFAAEGNDVFTAQVLSLNNDALEISKECLLLDRTSLNKEKYKALFFNFATRFNQVQSFRHVDSTLNPFCYFLRGLQQINTYQYDSALEDLRSASTRAKKDLQRLDKPYFPEHMRAELPQLLRSLAVIATYFQGIAHKNVGRYDLAQRAFHSALELNPYHLSSLEYAVQVEYLNDACDFASLQTRYQDAYELLQNIKANGIPGEHSWVSPGNLKAYINKSFSILKTFEGNMYLKKEIPCRQRARFQSWEDTERAATCYWDAYEYSGHYHAAFSLSQALRQLGSSHWRRRTPKQLLEEAFVALKKQVTEDDDRLYSVTLYYMLGICAKCLENERDTSYFTIARDSFRQVPDGVFAFSPISKVRLHRFELLTEMDLFERSSLTY